MIKPMNGMHLYDLKHKSKTEMIIQQVRQR